MNGKHTYWSEIGKVGLHLSMQWMTPWKGKITTQTDQKLKTTYHKTSIDLFQRSLDWSAYSAVEVFRSKSRWRECRGGCRAGGRCQGAAAETAQKLFNRSGFANWAKHWRVVKTDWFVLNLRVAKENTIKLVLNRFIGLHNVHLGSWRLEYILNKLSLSTTWKH